MLEPLWTLPIGRDAEARRGSLQGGRHVRLDDTTCLCRARCETLRDVLVPFPTYVSRHCVDPLVMTNWTEVESIRRTCHIFYVIFNFILKTLSAHKLLQGYILDIAYMIVISPLTLIWRQVWCVAVWRKKKQMQRKNKLFLKACSWCVTIQKCKKKDIQNIATKGIHRWTYLWVIAENTEVSCV